jgi:uncharacterized RDD family membrane protein YckC
VAWRERRPGFVGDDPDFARTPAAEAGIISGFPSAGSASGGAAMSEMIGPSYRRKDYAGFFRRTLALFLDLVIVVLVSSVIAEVWRSLAGEAWTEEQADAVMGGVVVIGLVTDMLSFRLLLKGTLGYRIVRIRYAYMLAEKPPLTAIAFRSFAAVVLLLFFGLDHLWILFDEHKQAWHDKISGFYVVKSKAQPTGMQPVVRRLINFFMLTFIVWEPAGRAQPADARQPAQFVPVAGRPVESAGQSVNPPLYQWLTAKS